MRPAHLAEHHPTVQLLPPIEALAILASWAWDDFAFVESLHERVCGLELHGFDVFGAAHARGPDEHRALVLAALGEASL